MFFFAFRYDNVAAEAAAETPRQIGDRPEGENQQLQSRAPPDYQLSIKFRARVCKSVLWTDIGSSGILFDDCIIGGTYFKDFTIWNRSEIELRWTINDVDLVAVTPHTLEFTDYDTGQPLDFLPIPPYSPKRIRVTFKPKETTDISYNLQIENENDSTNFIETRIHAHVRSVLREETLVINTGNLIDFSDCCAGTWKNREVILRNVSDAALEIQFTCEDADVIFRLRNDEMDTELLRPIPMGQLSSSDQLESRASRVMSRTASEISGASFESQEFSVGNNLDFDSLSMDGQLDAPLQFDRSSPELPAREELAKIEELLLKPGKERRIEVCYNPPKDPLTEDFRGGRLSNRSFRVMMAYCHPRSKHLVERKIVQCVARSCTSFIAVSTDHLHFGDTDGSYC